MMIKLEKENTVLFHTDTALQKIISSLFLGPFPYALLLLYLRRLFLLS